MRYCWDRSCLRSWLVQDSTCPTCRFVLKLTTDATTENTANADSNLTNNELQSRNSGFLLAPGLMTSRSSTIPSTPLLQQIAGGSARRNYFHFDGSRIASWLPSFSVEVTHGSTSASPPVANSSGQSDEGSSSQREYWTHQVHVLFPHLPISAIQESLASTNSIEVTVDHILEGTLYIPVMTSQLLNISTNM